MSHYFTHFCFPKTSNLQITNLVYIDAMVERPDSLKVILHPLLKLLGNLVQGKEVLQIPPLSLVKGPPRVHPLNDGSYVAKDDSVH